MSDTDLWFHTQRYNAETVLQPIPIVTLTLNPQTNQGDANKNFKLIKKKLKKSEKYKPGQNLW